MPGSSFGRFLLHSQLVRIAGGPEEESSGWMKGGRKSVPTFLCALKISQCSEIFRHYQGPLFFVVPPS